MSIPLPPGFRIGHASDTDALTGCTVLLCPPATGASCEVRGASPGSRELAALAPERSMQEVHAVLLTGGSAFGLAAADGVMRWLGDRGIGYATPWAKVPIVPAAVVFDMNVGRSNVRPDAAMAAAACDAAVETIEREGNVGAGTGATVGKWTGIAYAMKGGFGASHRTVGELSMTVVAVANAVGDVVEHSGDVLAGARSPKGGFAAAYGPRVLARGRVLDRTNTTLVAAMMNAAFPKVALFRIAQRMHDGMARAIVPCHTSFDGDVSFAMSCGTVDADLDVAAELAAELTAEAIRSAVRHADAVGSIPAVSTVSNSRPGSFV